MGSVHKFKPPKNRQQFKGYKPQPSDRPSQRQSWWNRQRPWARSAIAWLALLAIATAIVGVRSL